MKTISLGKYRALQQSSRPNHSFAILAADHRGNLRDALQKYSPIPITDEELTRFKKTLLTSLSTSGSAVLLDPEYSAAQLIASNTASGQRGLLVGIEKTGYSGDPNARENSLLPNWNVSKAKRMGANGIKLLVHYHPDSATAAHIEELVMQAVRECEANEIPLFLEPIVYSPNKHEPLSSSQRRKAIIASAKRFSALGIDVLKVEFPLDILADSDESTWSEACAELSTICGNVPWILLSGAVDYETYLRQVVIACRNGASGVAVGRAIWQEAIALSGYEREQFVREVANVRMEKITAICDGLARPWTDFYRVNDLTSTWYVNY